MSLQEIAHKIWYPGEDNPATSLAARLLYPPACLYGGMVLLRNRLYDTRALKVRRLPCPVVSVGNITVGGTGKTPTVIRIAEILAAAGRRPAILSRGYGGASRAPVNIVSDGKTLQMQAGDAGDEPVLMARKLPGIPVLTGPQRYLTGQTAIQNFTADCLILDDGFQHRELLRDLDIVLLDGRHPLGNGFTLPAGPLREPPIALRRADAIVVTGGDKEGVDNTLHRRLGHFLREGAPLFRGRHQARDLIRGGQENDVRPLSALRDKRLCAFSGIAAPDAFRRSLVAAGGAITSFFAFPDHYSYTGKDIYAIGEAARREQADMIISTEKDGVKLQAFPDLMDRIFLLRITMEINGEGKDFPAWLQGKMETWKRP